MFFASNGRGGEGSFDIFITQRLDDTWLNWSEPMNLGSKVNTKGQELSFVFREEAEYAYLISTQNSDGYGDLKRVKIKPDIVPEVVIEDTVSIVEEKITPGLIEFVGVILDKKTKKVVQDARVGLVK